ncbi:MAG: hypothetical protein BWK76_26460 [Desulfobulbaceae bacterium A2]|nr:MAG: hypothetical protein BWK76_26460 [Desulfobulbaceae bacterium A2]
MTDTIQTFLARQGPQRLRELLREMLYLRRFEEKIVEVYPRQDMKSPVHLYIGQEAVAAGCCAHLHRDDYLFTNHRSHGHCLAKGADPFSLYAEFYGRVDGCCHGKGGSMHPAYPELGILGTSAIVGGGIPLAVGAALAAKLTGSERIAICFFGDGAAEQGSLHESLGFASLKKLPVVFVCENNLYAVASPLGQRQPASSIADRARAHALPACEVDGNDVGAVYEAAAAAVGRARAGDGPSLLECRTYRWKGHVGPDCDSLRGCRDKAEIDRWIARCPIKLVSNFLQAQQLLTEEEFRQWQEEIDGQLDTALTRARASKLPGAEELLQHVYRS